MISPNKDSQLTFRVAEADSRDVGRGLVRMDPQDMASLGVRIGDIVSLAAEKSTLGKVLPCKQEDRGRNLIRIDGLLRAAAGCNVDSQISITPVNAEPAESVRLRSPNFRPIERDLEYLSGLVDGVPVQAGGKLRAKLFGNESIDLEVEQTEPLGPVVIVPTTQLIVEGTQEEQASATPSYEDVGGARPQLKRIREMIELPLRFPEVFSRLGIDPPKGVLLYGPPGCGKTLIARTIAHETDAAFFTISGPEIIHKFYGESEAHLRKIFQEAAKKGPSIIFLDEIDAIAPRRENAAGDVERRVVAQLLALMDGLKRRENVIVIAATNLPNAIDPALRRPGRFDREIEIPIPDRSGRRHILDIHSRGMPLMNSVDLDHLAAITHGFVGADLEALCREAAMSTLRGVIDEIDFSQDSIPYDRLARLGITMDDFMSGLTLVEPSAIREVFVEVPIVHWDDIGGLSHVKEAICEAVIWPLRYGKLFEQVGVCPPKGLLLSGPPGCGKTTLAKAAATESQVNFISVKGPELLSKFVGDSEKAVREVFSKARQAAPCIVFFDEIDGLCARRDSNQSDSGVSNRLLSQFLAEMDGIEELGGVFVLAATNRPDVLDPALLRFGRFEQTLEIDLPDLDSRLEILSVHTRDKPICSEIDLADLAQRTESWSGADLASLCNEAARQALRRTLRNSKNHNAELAVATNKASDGSDLQPNEVSVMGEDFEAALISVSTSKEVVKNVPTGQR